jgi:hypothetical protein
MLYKLTGDLMVLGGCDNHMAAVGLPAGRIIDLLGPAEDDRFVRIQVDHQVFEAFETDVRARIADCAPPVSLRLRSACPRRRVAGGRRRMAGAA